MGGQPHLGAAAVRACVEAPVGPVIAGHRLVEVVGPAWVLGLVGLLGVEPGMRQIPVEQAGATLFPSTVSTVEAPT